MTLAAASSASVSASNGGSGFASALAPGLAGVLGGRQGRLAGLQCLLDARHVGHNHIAGEYTFGTSGTVGNLSNYTTQTSLNGTSVSSGFIFMSCGGRGTTGSTSWMNS